MAKSVFSLKPDVFWKVYSEALNRAGRQQGILDSYKKDDKVWTKHAIKIAENVIKSFYQNDDRYPIWQTQTEYLRVDIIGYLTDWDNPKYSKKQHDWQLKIAYEHENSNNWHDELSKLCHVVADLHVISSYHNFRDDESIIELLQERVERLGIWRLHRIPNRSWLFVFGPRIHYSDKFRAFTIDTNLKVTELNNNEDVIPDSWN